MSAASALVFVVGLALVVFLYREAREASPGVPEYIALGSSYASGPFVTRRAENSPIFCTRSRDNYAQRVARDLGLSLVDMSCAGATTVHVLQGGQIFQGPQIAAIDRRTRLVTLTIGGNDAFYLANIVAESCDHRTPTLLRALGTCKERSESAMSRGWPQRAATFA